jgi:type IV pilus assembly protein PilM
MFNLGKTKSLIGLDIGSSSVKAVELKKTKAGYELVSYGTETLAQDTVVDGAIMDAPSVAEKIISIFDNQKIKTKDVATSVSGHSVIVKRVSMPLMTEDELFDRVQAEASQHIPFDIADVNLSHQLLEATENQMDVLLVAVKKDKILNHTNVLAQAGKAPVVVDIDAFALQNFASGRFAQRRRQRHEHQHRSRLDPIVHPRRIRRRQSVHRRVAEGTGPEL